MDKQFIAICAAIILVTGGFVVFSNRAQSGEEAPVSTGAGGGGKQIISILAKGGYSPQKISAKAGEETVLRLSTNKTFDCSASVIIPALSYEMTLPPTGSQDVPIRKDQAQGTLRGSCSMGMYGFEIAFK